MTSLNKHLRAHPPSAHAAPRQQPGPTRPRGRREESTPAPAGGKGSARTPTSEASRFEGARPPRAEWSGPDAGKDGQAPREVLKALGDAADANRVSIVRDDFTGGSTLKASGTAKREVELAGQDYHVLTTGSLEASHRQTGRKLPVAQALTRAGYDVSRLTRPEQLKLLDGLHRKTERQLGRALADFAREVADSGKDGVFRKHVEGLNGQRYLLAAEAKFDDALKPKQGDAVYTDWDDRQGLPDFAAARDSLRERQLSRDRGGTARNPWDRVEARLGAEERLARSEPIVRQLKYDALFGDGDVHLRTGVDGSSGTWDFDVDVERFDFAATRVQKGLYDGDTADFLGQLVRAHRALESPDLPVRGGQPFKELMAQLGSKDWKGVRGLVEQLSLGLPPKPDEAGLKQALRSLSPELRKELRGAERQFFDAQLGRLQLEMMTEAVEQSAKGPHRVRSGNDGTDSASVSRDFIFGDKKIRLKLDLQFDIEQDRVKPPLFDRILQMAGVMVGFVGGFMAGAVPALAGAVAGTQAVIGGVQALRSGDWKGFTLNLLSAAGSGMFGVGGFQKFASTASRIAGGVDGLVSGRNFLDKLSGVAQLAGVGLDEAGARDWSKQMGRLSKLSGIGSHILEKDSLGLFTASLSLVGDVIGEDRFRRARAEQLRQILESSSIRPLSTEEAVRTLKQRPELLEDALKAGWVSYQTPDGTWERLTPERLAQLERQHGSAAAALKAGQLQLGFNLLPPELARVLGLDAPGDKPFKPAKPKDVDGGGLTPIVDSRGHFSNAEIATLGRSVLDQMAANPGRAGALLAGRLSNWSAADGGRVLLWLFANGAPVQTLQATSQLRDAGQRRTVANAFAAAVSSAPQSMGSALRGLITAEMPRTFGDMPSSLAAQLPALIRGVGSSQFSQAFIDAAFSLAHAPGATNVQRSHALSMALETSTQTGALFTRATGRLRTEDVNLLSALGERLAAFVSSVADRTDLVWDTRSMLTLMGSLRAGAWSPLAEPLRRYFTSHATALFSSQNSYLDMRNTWVSLGTFFANSGMMRDAGSMTELLRVLGHAVRTAGSSGGRYFNPQASPGTSARTLQLAFNAFMVAAQQTSTRIENTASAWSTFFGVLGDAIPNGPPGLGTILEQVGQHVSRSIQEGRYRGNPAEISNAILGDYERGIYERAEAARARGQLSQQEFNRVREFLGRLQTNKLWN
jgi:hypothetical protein